MIKIINLQQPLSLYIKGVMKSEFYYTSLKTIWSLSKSIKTLDFS